MTGDTREISVRWRERLVFEAGPSGRPFVLVDGDGALATSPSPAAARTIEGKVPGER